MDYLIGNYHLLAIIFIKNNVKKRDAGQILNCENMEKKT